jgi:RNA-directed DNA polymerase
MEGRGRLGGTPSGKAEGGTQRPQRSLPPNLERVKQAIVRDPQAKLTALMHHIDLDSLKRAFGELKTRASAGVDGLTKAEYEKQLEANLIDLHERVQSGRYVPLPSRRTYIPKADGSQRPLGILALEDKIVQRAVTELLTVIYELEFLDFSYGFRPGRSPRMAADALQRLLLNSPVNFVLDADLSKCFDSIDHEKMLGEVAKRIGDPRLLRLLERWLKAGILEGEELIWPEEGTPQGAPISPSLANVFLHYVVDEWAVEWSKAPGRQPMIIVRFADDFVMGFKSTTDAWQMRADLARRLECNGLKLNETKTRLIEFGRFAAERRRNRGKGRPETFDFMGFTHYCSASRDGRFMVKRKTQGKRLRKKVAELRDEAHKRMHRPVKDQHQWLCSVLRGHYQYFGVRCNYRAIASFFREVLSIWKRALGRRSQKARMTWKRFEQLLAVFPLPQPKIARNS